MEVQTVLTEAVGHLRAGRLEVAEELLRRVLDAAPEQPDALHFLGMLAFHQGRIEDAIDLIERALQAHPSFPDALNSLGNILKEKGDLDGAASRYRRAIEIRPAFPESLANLGIVLRAQGSPKEAVEMLRRAIALSQDNPDLLHNLALALRSLDRDDEAIRNWKRALAIRPGHAEALRSLGTTLVAGGRIEEATEHYREWARREPENPIAGHLLAACTGDGVPDRAPDAYVRAEFDHMAGGFDDQARRLDYQAPDLVGTQLTREFGKPSGSLVVLDGGCGTGLTAEVLRPFAGRLVGLDLSPRMLAAARERGVHDVLVEEELTGHLLANPDTYDLVVGADTLACFGDLGPFLDAAHTALESGGHVLFMVESADPREATPFRLMPHGRYAHTRDYLERAVADAGFEVTALAHDVLRVEAGEAVACMVLMARKT